MSFRKMLKSKGPKIDPCETLLSTFPHSLKELFILHNLKSVSKPYALDFASSSSWFRLLISSLRENSSCYDFAGNT